MSENLENELRDLRERLLALEVESRSDRRWLMIVGGLLLGLLGYTSFIGVTLEVKSKLPAAVITEVKNQAPQLVKEKFSAWLDTNQGEVLLGDLRRAQLEVSQIRARAASEEADIRKALEAQSAENLNTKLEDLRRRVDNSKPVFATVINALQLKSVLFTFDGTNIGKDRPRQKVIEGIDPAHWQPMGSWLSLEASGFVKDVKKGGWWAAGAFGAKCQTVLREGHYVAELQQFLSHDNGDDGGYAFRLRYTTLFVRK